MLKKWITLVLAALFIASAALASPAIPEEDAFKRGKNVLALLSYGEFEKAYEQAAFSDPDVTYEAFSQFMRDNFYDLFNRSVQSEVSVFCYDGERWTLYIPVLTPAGEHGEVLTLTTPDGAAFDGYGCVDLSDMRAAAEEAVMAVWNEAMELEIYIIQVDD